MSANSLRIRNRKIPLRVALLALVAVALLPALAMVHVHTGGARAARERAILGRGQEVSALAGQLLDRAIRQRGLLLSTLASSQNLMEGRLEQFHAFAKRVVSRDNTILTLHDREGGIVLSTIAPFGAPLPQPVDRETTKRALASGTIQTSGVFSSPFSGADVLSILLKADHSDHVLRLTLRVEQLSQTLKEIAPAGWTLTVLDANQLVVAQSDGTNRRIGQYLPDLMARTTGISGSFQGVSAKGQPSTGFWKRTEYGWTVVAVAENSNIAPDIAEVLPGLPTMLALVVAGSFVVVVLGALLIERPLRRLADAAASVGGGPDARAISSGIKEVDEVGTALADASRRRAAAEANRAGLLAEIARQRVLFQSVFTSSPDCIIVTNSDRSILEVNPAAMRVLGYEADELRGRSTRTIFATEADWKAAGDRFESESATTTVDFDGVRKNGTSFQARAFVAPLLDQEGVRLGQLSIIRDVEAEQGRETALAQRQQLETLGRLTGGIAHDFNNLLTVISGHLQLLEGSRLEERQQARVTASLNAVQMGARLNQRLMTFARQRDLASSKIELNEIILSLLDLLERAVGEHIDVHTALHAEPLWAWIDRSELENALLNLSLNARDAMPEGGALRLETGVCDLDASAAATMGGLQPGQYLKLSVTDTGTGMAPSVIARAFEPFFTTKPVGKGSGLGLSTIHGFVRQSNGHIWIDSKLNAGTTVNILLPALAPAEPVTVAEGDADGRLPRGQGETILVVEDQPAVAALTRDRLSMLGYRVFVAHNGPAALKIVTSSEKLDLVFTDIVMPGGMSGYQLAERCAELRPRVRILLTSGFPDAAGRNNAAMKRFQRLDKPYTQIALAEAVSGALAGEAACVAAPQQLS